MRKRLIDADSRAGGYENSWLDLGRLAAVEVTSEDAGHPVEAALLPGPGVGWRASGPGDQTVRLLFDEPQRLSRVRLMFVEEERERTQEFVLRWSPGGGGPYREVVRQRWNFSPRGSTREEEDYRVDLSGVAALELVITPDVGRGGRAGVTRAVAVGVRVGSQSGVRADAPLRVDRPTLEQAFRAVSVEEGRGRGRLVVKIEVYMPARERVPSFYPAAAL